MLTTYLQILKEIKEDIYFKPGHDWPDFYFKQRCYEISAIDEITSLIKQNWPKRTPKDVIFEYLKYNHDLIYYSDDIPEEANLMLTIKCAVAEEVGCYFV